MEILIIYNDRFEAVNYIIQSKKNNNLNFLLTVHFPIMLNIQLQGGVEQEMVLEIGDDVLVRRKRAAGQTFKKKILIYPSQFFFIT